MHFSQFGIKKDRSSDAIKIDEGPSVMKTYHPFIEATARWKSPLIKNQRNQFIGHRNAEVKVETSGFGG